MVAKYDFSQCLVDFTSAPAGVKLIEYFPELSAFPEFVDISDNEIKIAIAISDLGSPFLKIKENDMRLKALFEFLGIGLKTKSNQELFQQIVDYRHERITAACCRHIQRQNNHAFASWWSLNIAFYFLQKQSATAPKEGEDALAFSKAKSFMGREMDALGEKLAQYEAKIFKDTKMKQAIVDHELKKIVTFPEQFAETHPGF